MEKEKRNAWKRAYMKNPINRKKATEYRRKYLENPKVRARVQQLQRERYKRPEIQAKHKDGDLKHNFGISLEEYQELFNNQNGLCAICNNKEHRTYNGKVKSLAVDHNHLNGKVRGLLCHDCNVALGYVKDDRLILGRMITYIEKFNSANNKPVGEL